MNLVEESSPVGVSAPEPCASCGRPLPLRLVGDDDEAQDWSCTGCNAVYHAILAPGASPELRKNVRLMAPPVHSGSEDKSKKPLPKRRDHGEPPLRTGAATSVETPLSRGVDEEVERSSTLHADPQGTPFVRGLEPKGAAPYDRKSARELVEVTNKRIDALDRIFQSLGPRDAVDPRLTQAVTSDALHRAADDLDVFALVGVNPVRDSYPTRHAYQVAMLAMAIGAQLKWNQSALVDLGIGCLVHDAGMLRVEERVFGHARQLDDAKFAAIARHPIYTLDMLGRNADRFPQISRLVAFQMHERPNGSGYPRGRSGGKIHRLAKVAAVADVYVALASPRPHRPALQPYQVMEHLLFGVHDGLFDSQAVRGLLHAVSLFPIGSRVKLSDGRQARVLRANGAEYLRPVVELISDKEGDKPEIIDLSQESSLSIVRPAAEAKLA